MALLLVGLAACRPQPEREAVLVFAAASLTDVMADMETLFEATHPSLDAVVTVGASSLLARQIERGAPAAVFLSASPTWTDFLAERGLMQPAQPLVGNRLVVIGRGEAALLDGLTDLLRFDRVALADARVPAGQYAREGLERAGLWDRLADRVVPALDVRAAVAAVRTGAAPVGIVYASDVLAARDVRVLLDWPERQGPRIRYTVAVAADAPHGAEAFAAFVRDPAREAVWRRFGFLSLGEALPDEAQR